MGLKPRGRRSILKMMPRSPAALVLLLLSSAPACAYYTNQPADLVVCNTDPNADKLVGLPANQCFNPAGVAIYGSTMVVSEAGNHRVTFFDAVPSTHNASADYVLGQFDFTTNNTDEIGSPHSVRVHEGKLFVCDSDNSRILIYDTLPTTNTVQPSRVLGQATFSGKSKNQGGGVSGAKAWTLSQPDGMHIQDGKLWVADAGNNRVLRYDLASVFAATANVSANLVLGQSDFTSVTANRGGSTAANTLSNPVDVSGDGTRLFVLDRANHRLLIFNTAPTTDGASADFVIGQLTMSGANSNQSGGAGANTLNSPFSAEWFGGRLFIADDSNNRLLVYNQIPGQNNISADIVVGQQDFTKKNANQGLGTNPKANTLSSPYQVFVTTGSLWVADRANSRVLRFSDVFGTYLISPSTAVLGSSVTLRLSGDGFLAGSTVALLLDGSATVDASAVNVVSSKTIDAVFTFSNNTVGKYDVVVTSGNVKHNLKAGLDLKAFSVSNIIPNFGYRGLNVSASVTGSDFLDGSTVKLTRSGETDIEMTVTSKSSTSIAGTVNLGQKALGLWNVVVTSGSNSTTLSNGFLVSQFPTLSVTAEASKTLGSSGGSLSILSSVNGLAGLTLTVPSGAIPASVSVDVSMGGVSNAPDAPKNKVFLKTPVDLSPSGMEFLSEVDVEIPYTEAELTALGLSDPSELEGYSRGESASAWTKMTTVVDRVNKRVKIKTTHFSLFALAAPTGTDVDAVDIFPNPFLPGAGHTKVSITKLPQDSTIRIYTQSGDLVDEISNGSSGSVTWDGKTASGGPAVSGVYYILIDSSLGRATKKLAVER